MSTESFIPCDVLCLVPGLFSSSWQQWDRPRKNLKENPTLGENQKRIPISAKKSHNCIKRIQCPVTEREEILTNVGANRITGPGQVQLRKAKTYETWEFIKTIEEQIHIPSF